MKIIDGRTYEVEGSTLEEAYSDFINLEDITRDEKPPAIIV